MATYLQADQPLAVTTPLGSDVLLLKAFAGDEGLSRLFHFELEVLAENKIDIAFDRLLGQKVTATLALPGGKRYFNGVCNRVSQGERGPEFTTYRLEVVPQFWLLTKRAQSRIFQHISVPDILKKVLTGLDVSFELQGKFEPRDYCVQYRETDFNFASRLMEEEGIYYFFKHTAGGHSMVVANSPGSHADVPGPSKVIYEQATGGNRPDDRVYEWEKAQELRAGKYTLWDHCFELPHKHLEAEQVIQESIAVGTVTHKLKLGGSDKLETYDYPGGYAQRFAGIDRGGGAQPGQLQGIFQDNKRTAGLRMQEEALGALVIRGAGTCRQFVSGHKFTLESHFNADGQYVLTSVTHAARIGAAYRSDGDGATFDYENHFTCIPAGLPYRPPRHSPKPVVQGSQTAVVVGPAGEEIFCDKYGRVKVQFHWDRDGKHDADSSCWCRVSTLWAGKQWGVIHIPRVGQEVIVDFLEGDPDRPIITGSVYNAEMMPPYALPDHKTQSGVKTRSSLTGTADNFNEIRFEDKKGQEQLYIHAERNQDVEVEKDQTLTVGHDRSKTVGHDETTSIKNNRTETVDNDESITIKGNRTEDVGKSEQVKIGKDRQHTVGGKDTLSVGTQLNVSAGDQIVLQSGEASITLKKDGSIVISGKDITISSSATVSVKGTMVKLN